LKGRAAILVERNKPLVIDEVEFPDPGPGQVLVKLFASGICHSQLHQIDGTMALGRLPQLLGHEATGVVVAKGVEVDHVKEGDYVLTTWVNRSGPGGRRSPVVVYWRGQEVQASAATWAEYALCPEQLIVPMEKDFPTDVTAIIGCAVMTGAGTVLNTLKVKPGESVAIFGVGGVGICALVAAAVCGAQPIIAVDLSDEKLEYAKRYGATHGINARNEDPVQAIRTLLGGGPATGFAGSGAPGVDYAIDAIGAVATQQQILLATRPGGTAMLIGVPAARAELDTTFLLFGNRIYRGAMGGNSVPDRDFPLFLQWYREGKLPLDALVTQRYTLDQINEAVDDLHKGRIQGRAIITY
jgi:Zn-dependent alcohol dehydrogenase